jgi:prophage tail gpP-like protein
VSKIVNIIIGSDKYEGWESVNIKKSIETLTGSFSLALADRFSPNQDPFIFHEQDAAVIKIDDEKIITGYIDKLNPSVSGEGVIIAIEGRDKTADLVDCSADYKTNSFNNSTFSTIATELCSVYDIDVVIDTDLSGNKINKFSINTGETVFEALERLARAENVIMISDAEGRLVITRAGTEKADTSLVYGENILSASATFDSTNRFYKYIIKADAAGKGKDSWSKNKAGIKGEAIDDEIIRTARTLIIKAETNSTADLSRKRADWEKVIRKARGFNITASIQGWRRTATQIWEPNLIIPVIIPAFEIDEELLISEVTFKKDSEGTVADLKLVPKETFTTEPKSDTKRKKGIKWD